MAVTLCQLMISTLIVWLMDITSCMCCLLHIGMQYQYHLVEYNTSHLFDKEMFPLQDKYAIF